MKTSSIYTIDLNEEEGDNKNPEEKDSKCVCAPKIKVNQMVTLRDFKVSSMVNDMTKEIINGVEFGIPNIFGKMIILPDDFQIKSPFTKNFPKCPKGYRPLNKDDLTELQSNSIENFNILTNSKLFNFNTKNKYVLDSKVQTNSTQISDSNSFIFEGLSFNELGKVVNFINFNTYFDKNLKYKCILDSNNYELEIEVKENDNKKPVSLGDSVNLVIKNTNIKSLIWKVNQITLENSNKYTFDKEGCNYIYSWGVLFNNEIVYGCSPIDIKGVSENKQNKDIVHFKTFQSNAMLKKYIIYEPPSAPFAIDDNNRIIVTYTNKDTHHLHIMILENSLNLIVDKDLDIEAVSFDIVINPSGTYIILCRDYNNPDILYLYTIDVKLNFVWKRFLMTGNLKIDVSSGNPISFKNKNGGPEFGLNNMFKATSGNLTFGGGKISVLFSHGNNFGKNEKGSETKGMGLTLIIVDENGQNETLGFSWGASPPLQTDMATDGKNLITAALAGQFPNNIQVCNISLKDFLPDLDFSGKYYKQKTNCKNLLEHGIISDGKGSSCGRLGDIIYDDKLDTYAIVFSVRSCKTKNGYAQKSQFSLALFDTNLNLKHYTNLGQADNIICIKTAKFGNNLAIVYTVTNDDSQNFEVLPNHLNKNNTSFLLLLDFNGNIVSPATKLEIIFCDELSTLKDGSVAWTHVHEDATLTVMNYIEQK